jgi:hypothetical protein
MSCCVCLDELRAADEVVVLRPCRHSGFHASCIEEVLDTDARYRCPLCRTTVREVHYEIESIIEHRTTTFPCPQGKGGVKRFRQYRCVWKGFPRSDAQWIDEAELRKCARRMLREYQESDAMNMIDLIATQAKEDLIDLSSPASPSTGAGRR